MGKVPTESCNTLLLYLGVTVGAMEAVQVPRVRRVLVVSGWAARGAWLGSIPAARTAL